AAGTVGAGVRVERLQLAGAALHPQQDNRLRRPALVGGPFGGAGQQVAHRRQPAQARQPGHAKEVAAAGAHAQWFHLTSVLLTKAQKMSSSRWLRSLPRVPRSRASK